MGSTFTKKQAAETLGVSERMVYHYIKNGYLRREEHRGQVCVKKDDVLMLKEAKEKELPFPVNKITLSLLHSRLSKLEREMEIVKRLLNIRGVRLQLDRRELKKIYDTCLHNLKNGVTDVDVEIWSDLFLRLHPEDLETLKEVSGDSYPWAPFYKYCLLLIETRGESIELSSGLSNIRSLMSIWAERHGDTIRRTKRLENYAEKVVRKIIKKSAKKRKK